MRDARCQPSRRRHVLLESGQVRGVSMRLRFIALNLIISD